jgi:PAS domain-containing protein
MDELEIMRRVYRELNQTLDAQICFFGLYDDSSQTVDVIWQVHEGAELPGGQFPLGNGLTSQVVRTRVPQLIRNWRAQAPPVQVQYATERPQLPDSAIVVPVIFADRVLGVLSIQNYRRDAFDADDLDLAIDVADLLALALSAARGQWREGGQKAGKEPTFQTLVASMPDALVVLDDHGRLTHMNRAARELLCMNDSSVIAGQPVDQDQDGRWPLGSSALTDALRPMIEQLRRGENPQAYVEVALHGQRDHVAGCRGSVLLRDGQPIGGVLMLREMVHPGAT